MGQIQHSNVIHAPISVVWDTLNDIANTPKWVVGLVDAKIVTDEPYGLGSTYHDYNRLGPVIQTTPWLITIFEPMSKQVHVSESINLPSTMTLTLIPTIGGTEVCFKVDYQFMPQWGSIGHLLERTLMNHMIKRVIRQNLDQLDRYLLQSTIQRELYGSI